MYTYFFSAFLFANTWEQEYMYTAGKIMTYNIYNSLTRKRTSAIIFFGKESLHH